MLLSNLYHVGILMIKRMVRCEMCVVECSIKAVEIQIYPTSNLDS